MPYDTALDAAIALTRFGLGARPSELAVVGRDPQGWLAAQIRAEGADQPVAAPLPPHRQPPIAASAAPSDMTSGVQTAAVRTRAPPGQDMGPGQALSDAKGAGAEGTLLQPAVLTFTPGQSLPTMQDAFHIYADAQRQARAVKGEPGGRRAAVEPVLEEAGEEIFARFRLAAATPAGFRERWTLFWANHFTMAAKALPEAAAAGPFEREAIRPHVFGRFADLLTASTRHPGMLLYLDQAQSIGPNSQAAQTRGGKAGLNENLAREVLELHTVGADAGYTQADVIQFARALTGWSMGGGQAPAELQGLYYYRGAFHEPGARTVMGREYREGGEEQALAILRDLAEDPRTARRLASKIAVHFVADDPPKALTARLEAAYVRSGGDLAEVAHALISAPEAWAPAPMKMKTPYEFLVSAYRAAGVLPGDPAREIVQPLTALGMRPFGAPQPNGWSELAADWAAPDAVVKRLLWAQRFAAAHAPDGDPAAAADAVLGARLSARTRAALSRAESRPQAFALLLMSPEFQRR